VWTPALWRRVTGLRCRSTWPATGSWDGGCCSVAALGSDGNNDTAPSITAGVDFPIHVLAINAMGLHLLDYLRFEELAARCAEAGRWSFLCVIAPLRLPSATGSPVNPIAIL
jgi:hypothetical protein